LARAGIIEIIAEMSGPQMIGYFEECRLLTDGRWASCTRPLPFRPTLSNTSPSRRFWLSVGGGIYVSTPKDVGGVERGWGDAFMATFEPIFEFQSKKPPWH